MKKAIMLTLAALLVAGSVAAAPEALAQKGKGKGGGGGGGGAEAPSKPLPPRPEFTTGIVSSFVVESRMLKFNTGGEYKLTSAASTAPIHVGDKVQLRWMMKGGVRIADEASVTQAGVNPTPAAATPAPATPAPATPAPASTVDKPATPAPKAPATPS